MLHVVLRVFARNSCLFLAGQYPSGSSVLHVVLWVFARNSCLFLAGQYPSEFYVACCVVGICKKQLFVSSWSIPIRILCCMLCCGYLQEIAVCFQPVNTHPNSMLHVVLWVFANSCLLLAGQYLSELHFACCVEGICKQLFVSSRPIPIRIAFCMLCCGYLQIAVCCQPVNTHLNSMFHVVLWVSARHSCLLLAGQYPSEFYFECCVVGICKKQMFVSSWSIPIRILCCMLCCGYLQIAVCLQPANTHPNSMLHVVLWVFARNSCLSLAGQYPSEFYVACCVAGICKQLFV